MRTRIFSLLISSLLLGCQPKKAEVDMGSKIAIPEVAAAVDFIPEMPSIFQNTEGLNIWLVENHQLPVVVMQIVLPGGASSDPVGQSGQAELVAQMLLQSVGDSDATALSSTELSKAFYQQAAEITIDVQRRQTIIEIAAHKDRLDAILPLVQKMIFEPQFLESDWNRVVERHRNSVQQVREDARAISSNYAGYFLYGEDHPLGRLTDGTPASLGKIDREAAQKWHQSRLRLQDSALVVVGALNQERVNTLSTQYFNAWSSESQLFEQPQFGEVTPKTGIYLVDMPGAEQTAIRVFSPAYERNSEDAIAAHLASVAMGGSFTSRLNALLREEKGYTYGAGCSFVEGYYGNFFVAQTSVQIDVTAAALTDMFMVLDTAKEGFSEDELKKSLSSFKAEFVDLGASRSNYASELVDLWAMGLEATSLSEDLQQSNGITVDDLQKVSQYFDRNRGIVLLVGDASVVLPQLREANFSVTQVELPE